jgi:hypothetical protein
VAAQPLAGLDAAADNQRSDFTPTQAGLQVRIVVTLIRLHLGLLT